MKFSENTIEILKNFGSINQSMEFKTGKNQYSISPTKTVMGYVELHEEIDRNFCLYDLNQFLGVWTTMTDPDFHTTEKYLLIKDNADKTTVKLHYADPNAILRLEKELKEVYWENEFVLTKEVIEKIYKFSGLLKSKFVAFIGNGEKITVNSVNDATYKDLEDGNKTSFFIAESDLKFNIFIDKTNFVNKLLPLEYKVQIHDNKLMKFENEENKLKYILIGVKVK